MDDWDGAADNRTDTAEKAFVRAYYDLPEHVERLLAQRYGRDYPLIRRLWRVGYIDLRLTAGRLEVSGGATQVPPPPTGAE